MCVFKQLLSKFFHCSYRVIESCLYLIYFEHRSLDGGSRAVHSLINVVVKKFPMKFCCLSMPSKKFFSYVCERDSSRNVLNSVFFWNNFNFSFQLMFLSVILSKSLDSWTMHFSLFDEQCYCNALELCRIYIETKTQTNVFNIDDQFIMIPTNFSL